MNLMFWKKKKPHEADETEAGSDKTMAIAPASDPEEESGGGLARPGLATRLRSMFAVLGQRLRHRRNSDAGKQETADAHAATEEHAPPSRPPNLKKRLIIGGALGAAALLLAGIGFAAWKFLFSSHEAEPPPPPAAATHDSAPPPPAKPAQAEDETQAQLEALKKQNEEMARQLEALKKEKSQDEKGHEESAGATPKNGASAGGGDEVMVFSGKDPKASAQALKQAIEEMNAASGNGKRRKPAE